jgi:serine/threonine protein kinase
MNLDPDERLGAQLDSYLSALESGQSTERETPAAGEAADLQSLVQELHLMARILENPDGNETVFEVPFQVGKYEVRQPLGQGGQSRTWLAQDPDLERPVVLKLYRDAETATQQERVLREARALARVSSPHVARCFDADRHGEHPFLVLEYVSGSTLDRVAGDKPLPTKRIVELINQVAEGLAAVHSCGLIHRDIKPANIIIGDDSRAKIVDFGMAHIKATPVNCISGTPAYMAPEQARGEVDRIDNRTDVFGLGAVLYELLTGLAPFHRETRGQTLEAAREGNVRSPREVNPSVSRSLNQICMRCLAKEPVNRFATMEELRGALRSWQFRHQIWRAFPFAATVLLAFAAFFFLRPASTPSQDTLQRNRWGPISSATSVAENYLPDDALDFFAIDGRLRRDFWIEVDILGGEQNDAGVIQLSNGDRIAVRIRSERDCYVTILSYGPDAAVQLFPRSRFDAQDDGRVLAGQAKTVPRTDSPRSASILATPSTGKEALCVVASTKPISLGSGEGGDPQLVFRTAAEQAQLNSSIRGLVRRPETPAHAVSQLIIPYWVGAKP